MLYAIRSELQSGGKRAAQRTALQEPAVIRRSNVRAPTPTYQAEWL